MCQRRLRVAGLLAGMLLVNGGGLRAEEDAGSLLGKLPRDANAVIILRVAEILDAPLAQREGWVSGDDPQLLPAAGGIPHWVRTLVVGYRVRLAAPQELWATAVATTPEEITVERVAMMHGMPVEQLAGLPATLTPRGTQVVGLAPGLLAVRRPAVRQETAEWIGDIQSGRTGPAAAILQGLNAVSGQLVLAVDLMHALDPRMVRMHLAEEPALAGDEAALDRHAALLENLSGVQLRVVIADAMSAQARIEFRQPCDGDPQTLARFFLGTLNQLGASLDDFDQAAARIDGHALLLESAFSEESLTRIVSLITAAPGSSHDPLELTGPPAAGASATDPGAAPRTQPTTGAPLVSAGSPPRALTPEERTRRASRRYFDAVNRLLGDLERANRRATNYSQTTLWHENFARRILELPTRDVDPDLIVYGQEVASRLRGLARSLQGQAMEVNVQQGTLTYDVNFTPGWASVNVWGGVGFGESAVNVTSNLRDVRQRQAQAILAGEKERQQVWQMLADSRDQMEQRMQKKFDGRF